MNGLPKGALNITFDGIDMQDNSLNSDDGWLGRVAVSTATSGVESSAGGAVQIKFVTQGGTNDYHGGLYAFNYC